MSGGRSRLRRAASHGGGSTHDGAGGMRWLLTYADMITLLLALFIILFAVSTISKVKLQRLAHEISGGFSNVDANNTPPNAGASGREHRRSPDATIEQIKARLDRYIAREHLQSHVRTRLDRQGLIVTLLGDQAYYASGSARLRPETTRLLDAVGAQLRPVDNAVRVEGNTDDVPIATSEYPTNWELSAARATGVTRYLVERSAISPTRISFAGYGQYRPTLPNDSDAHRAQNRRVDVLILKAGQ